MFLMNENSPTARIVFLFFYHRSRFRFRSRQLFMDGGSPVPFGV
jgi:hypothetical protein